VVVAGDTFEKEEDIEDETIWKLAGTEDEDKLRQSRDKILREADFIIPGHGPMFANKNKYKQK